LAQQPTDDYVPLSNFQIDQPSMSPSQTRDCGCAVAILNSESDRLATVGCAKVDRLATVGDAREIVAGCGIGQVSKGSCPSLITNATTPQTYLHV